MNFRFTLILFIVFTSTIFAQKDSLTLEFAVGSEYQVKYPFGFFDIQWIPESDRFSFLDYFTNLKIKDTKTGESIETISIMDVNKEIKTPFLYFENLKWIDSTTFSIKNEKQIVFYNLIDKKAKSFELYSKHIDIENNKHLITFTKENNLSIIDGKGNTKKVTKNDDLNIVSGQAIARREMGIKKGTFWSPNANFLAFYQKDETNVTNYPLLDINETPGKLKEIKYPMAGQLSENPKVGIYNVKKNKTKFIVPRGEKDDYLTNVCWSLDGKHIIIVEVERSQKKLAVNLYDANKTEFIKTLFEEERETWVEPRITPFFISNEEFIWISDKDGFRNIYHYNINGKLINQLTENEFELSEIIGFYDKKIIYVATGPNPLNKLIYQVDLNGKQELISDKNGVHEAYLNKKNGKLLLSRSTYDTPNEIILTNIDGDVLQNVFKQENELKNYEIGETELVKIKSSDNQDLYSRIIYPSDFDSTKQYPSLTYVYGGPHAQLITNGFINDADLWMYWLANQGFIIYTLDNRGSDNRGVKFEHGIHRRVGELELEDQLLGAEYLKNLSFIDTNKMAVYGWSFGGFMTVNALLNSPNTYKVGVAGGAVTDWKYYEIMYGERYMDTPSSNSKGYKNSSLINKTKNLTGDLLLIHGTNDDVVVMQQSLMLVKKFIESKKQVDYFPYPMQKHNVSGEGRIHLKEKVFNYIIEKLEID